MINAIYLFVAILMFIVWVMNINPGEKHLKSVKRFHFIMQIIFLYIIWNTNYNVYYRFYYFFNKKRSLF